MKSMITALLCFVLIVPQLSCKKETEVEVSRLIVQTVVGNVIIKDTRQERKALIGDEIKQGDIITTAQTSLVDIQYGKKGAIRIDENSNVNITQLISTEAGEHGNLNMDKGKMFVVISKLKKNESFMVKTSTAVASVRGTSFRVISGQKRARIDTLSGKIKVNPVKNGKIITTVEKVIEKNVSVVMDEKAVDEVIEGKKEIATVDLKPEEVKEIKEEVKDIKLDKSMGEAVKKEIKEVVFEEKIDEGAKKEEERLKEAETKKAEEEKIKARKAQRKLQQDRVARDRSLKGQQEKARLEKARIEKERLEKAQQEKARKERERIEKAKKEREKKENRVKNIPNL